MAFLKRMMPGKKDKAPSSDKQKRPSRDLNQNEEPRGRNGSNASTSTIASSATSEADDENARPGELRWQRAIRIDNERRDRQRIANPDANGTSRMGVPDSGSSQALQMSDECQIGKDMSYERVY